jgi:hypothetical protein
MATERRRMIDSLVYYRLGQAESLMARAKKMVEVKVPRSRHSPPVQELLDEMTAWDREVRTLIKESLLEEHDGGD